MRTKSPKTNCDDDAAPDAAPAPAAALGTATVGDVIVGEERESTLSDVSDELFTLVKIAGLKVHLKMKQEEELCVKSGKGYLLSRFLNLHNREIKHQVYGKRLMAEMTT